MADNNDQKSYGYGKRPMWQWVLLYVILAAIVYGVGYYFWSTNNGTSSGTDTSAQTSDTQTTNPPPSPTPATPASVSATISNFSFSPGQITAKAGTTVTWTNNDSVAHTVTSDTGAFDSGMIAPGGTYSFTFNTPGTFAYHCTVHPMMKASVVVTQ